MWIRRAPGRERRSVSPDADSSCADAESSSVQVRKRRIQIAPTAWLRTVASAAPFTPMPNTKMKMGSRMMLITAPITVVIIPDLRESLCRDEEVHTHYNQDEDTSQNIDSGIIHSVRQRDVACAEQEKKTGSQYVEYAGQDGGEDKEQREAGSHDLLCGIVVLASHGDCGARRTAASGHHGKGVDQHQNRREQTHAS